jgi:hypothetical protein
MFPEKPEQKRAGLLEKLDAASVTAWKLPLIPGRKSACINFKVGI